MARTILKNASAILTLAALLTATSPAHADSTPISFAGTVWERVGQEKGLDPKLLYSVALAETRRQWPDGLIRPWPWAIAENGPKVRSHYPQSLEEAKRILQEALTRTKNIDVGVMQVNLLYHGHRIAAPEDLLDIEKNIQVGADILREAMASSKNKEVGVGRYHSWKPDISPLYGKRVLYLVNALGGW